MYLVGIGEFLDVDWCIVDLRIKIFLGGNVLNFVVGVSVSISFDVDWGDFDGVVENVFCVF